MSDGRARGVPEVADVGRAGRRLIRLGLDWARADETTTLPSLLAEHLGPEAAGLRRAALLAAEADGAGEFRRITREQARSALERLLAERNRLTRVLLGGEAPQAGAGVGGAGAEMPMPAPVARVGSVVISSFD
ncbi:MAG: hypothetical protein ACRENV_06915 [Candidatus Dormibacteria bacterium]